MSAYYMNYQKMHLYWQQLWSLLSQEKVACLDDNEARLALDPHNKYRIQVHDAFRLLYFLSSMKLWVEGHLYAFFCLRKTWILNFPCVQLCRQNLMVMEMFIHFSFQVASLKNGMFHWFHHQKTSWVGYLFQ